MDTDAKEFKMDKNIPNQKSEKIEKPSSTYGQKNLFGSLMLKIN
jgi:hypothetical protein